MGLVLKLIAATVTFTGWVALLLGGFFAGWFVWNFGGFLQKPHRHGELHWGVAACIFYATPAVVLVGVGALLVLLGRLF
jgi:hypothetical protein